MVCDEAHYLRNPASQRCKLLMPILQAASRAVLVTGTPTPKQASEAYSLIHALRPLSCSHKQWCERYAPVEASRKRESEVGALLAEVMVRREKSEVLSQLPERRRQCIALQLPKATESALRRLEGQRASDDEVFQELARVKEAAAEQYVEYLLEASSAKFLLFAHHKAMLDVLERAVTKHGTKCIRIDGSVKAVERAGLVSCFQREQDCRVAVLSVTAAGEGLTLTAATLCVFCELCPAVPGVMEQAEARVHRIGQRSAVDIHYLVVEGTRDMEVFQRLEQRSLQVARAIGMAGVGEVRITSDPTSELSAVDCAGDLGATTMPVAETPSRKAQAVAKVANVLAKQRKPRRRHSMEALLDAAISGAQAELLKPTVVKPPVVPLAAAMGPVAVNSRAQSGAGELCSASRPPARKRLRRAAPLEEPARAEATLAEEERSSEPALVAELPASTPTREACGRTRADSESEDDVMLNFFTM